MEVQVSGDGSSASEVVMAVDGNSLLHRSYHALASTGSRTVLGQPNWAVRGLLTQVVAAAERIGPTMVVVGFDDPDDNARRERWPDYKAQRADKLPTLVSQLDLATRVLAELGLQVVVPARLEADDVLASAARCAREAGGRCVLVTSDRDAFALIDDSTSVLRVISGGVEGSPMLNPDRLELLTGVRPEQYADFAALRGDPSDNLPGVTGIGPKRAAALLREFGTAEGVFAAMAAGGDAVRAVVGPGVANRLAAPDAVERWRRNREVMRHHDDVEIGSEAGRLPLSADEVHQCVLGHGLPGTALLARRVLGHEAPPDRVVPHVDELSWDSSAEWRSRQRMPPLPVNLQPALF
ncbi:5'-3' exonuclease H3TH domain-containing protein [Actinopolymorpha sp. NPDC004070]|uniref:5'-3' exonuclease n=1 Tax=Actinopolymorpha sp. NPDC004070 TaxID=3154548 RepID=UPI0033A2FB4B